ncbi:jg27639 [Pararge aegeria aegeria]|uniref:Jg27639 protein n=1 Tax=Pararge aegeria aegeria TaxID=348720 RepID=A0A8S4S2L2_9NEOP|nr:jg27639 [Pararge aegeria aegeria]
MDLDIENIDINNIQVIEKVGNDFIDLQQEPPEFATVAIEYLESSVLDVANITVENENVVQELGNASNQDILVSTNTQDPVSDIVTNNTQCQIQIQIHLFQVGLLYKHF